MLSADDVADYIVKKMGTITAMKLQKLIYYCQVWSLVWDEKPLFNDEIEAWLSGPVVRKLYENHKGQYSVNQWSFGDASKVQGIEKETIDSVLDYYGDKSAQWLSDLTHKEDPWLIARKGLSPNERGSRVISHADMMEYYGSLEED
ncbi:MAG: DUF4065 domain-containing protein [Candidatus Magnetoovum sp. WYHC-5]|nr:DUF4065 domain-containing protein [Candidatus Magnetoovum sp. WYHC-5]